MSLLPVENQHEVTFDECEGRKCGHVSVYHQLHEFYEAESRYGNEPITQVHYWPSSDPPGVDLRVDDIPSLLTVTTA